MNRAKIEALNVAYLAAKTPKAARRKLLRQFNRAAAICRNAAKRNYSRVSNRPLVIAIERLRKLPVAKLCSTSPLFAK